MPSHHTPPPARPRTAPAPTPAVIATIATLASLGALAACGGSGGGSGGPGGGAGAAHAAAKAQCDQPAGDSAYATALTEYLKGLQPTPLRFVVPIATDSMMPELARVQLGHKQPTYLWPKDAANQKKLLDKLSGVGPWPTLLVTWHGASRVDDTTNVMHLGGHYVGGDANGKAAPRRAIYFTCDTARWRFSRTEEEAPK